MPEAIPTRSTHKSVLDTHHTLVVGHDDQPIAYPPRVFNAQQTLSALLMERMEPVSWSPNWLVGINIAYQLPSVMRLTGYRQDVSLGVDAGCTADNIFVRDEGRCQYTGRPVSWNNPDPLYNATIDHVIPVWRGGRTVWQNVVLASAEANFRKGDRTPAEAGMKLRLKPWVPTCADLLCLWATEERIAQRPQVWRPYLHIIKPTLRINRIREGKLYAYAA